MGAARVRIAAELTWTGRAFEPGVVVEIGGDGRIAAVRREGESGDGGDGGSADGRDLLRLPRRALLPGLVNAHSHAFQRGLRGRGETFPAGAGSFWSWREEMYGLVGALDRRRLFDLSLAAFREMRAAGITAVGEFHYLHHDDPGTADFAFDEVVLAAAAEAPIRIVLLHAYYATGGIGRPLEGAQRRFACASPADYWRQLDRLAGRLSPDGTQTLAAVAHSIRAVPLDDLAALHREARRRGLPFHLHLEEQRREIEDCVAAHGRRPIELLLALDPGPETTAVHCTHSEPADLARFAAAGGHVCVCPLTEANLGDGIPPLAAVPAARDVLCLGSDSNARISLVEEARWLEYGQRLAGERRGALAGDDGEVAPVLLVAATAGGADALGLPAGEIAPGRWADLLALDLDHPSLAGAGADTLLAAFLFGAGDDAVAATALAGRWSPAVAPAPG
ncbi:MAG TPA: formimidoylglutamate deiminase [Thermoanaerobaculia bacterium]|nr:formimidoylglutamate deiminase [Thermoanaerobaculia bacterium]